MTRVDSDAWRPKAKKRKAYRDHMRDTFYREVGKGDVLLPYWFSNISSSL